VAAPTLCFTGAIGTDLGAVGLIRHHDGITQGNNAQAVGASTFHLGNSGHGYGLQMGYDLIMIEQLFRCQLPLTISLAVMMEV